MDANTSLRVAAAYLGGFGGLASKLDLSRQAIYKWKSTGIPLRRALEIERLTEGRIKASELCPGVFNEPNSTKQSAPV